MGQMMMYTPFMSRELQVFKIIIIYTVFHRIYRKWKKLEEGDGADDDVYILYV
jgi:hypothetical protein